MARRPRGHEDSRHRFGRLHRLGVRLLHGGRAGVETVGIDNLSRRGSQNNLRWLGEQVGNDIGLSLLVQWVQQSVHEIEDIVDAGTPHMSGECQTQAEILQRAYYASTAAAYDDAHIDAAEHRLGLQIMLAAIRHYGFSSVLDVGSGTGRALTFLKSELPAIRVAGIEPSPELRAIGHRKGLTADELQDGDALRLPFDDGAFDLVCEFSALHHIADPAQAVSEMLRVARQGIFISDTNNFGQGGPLVRLLKQAVNAVGLWPLADWIKTGGRGYSTSAGDGVAYSYSVFNDWPEIRRRCQTVHVVNTDGAGINPYRTAAHVAILGLKA